MEDLDQLDNGYIQGHHEDPSVLEGANGNLALRSHVRCPRAGIFDSNHFEIPAVQLPTPPSLLANVITTIDRLRGAFDPLYCILQAFADDHDPESSTATFGDVMASLSRAIQERQMYLHNYQAEARRCRLFEAQVRALREEYDRLLESHDEQDVLLSRFLALEQVRSLRRSATSVEARAEPSSSPAAAESTPSLRSNPSTLSPGSTEKRAARRLVAHINEHLMDPQEMERRCSEYVKRREVRFSESRHILATTPPLPDPSIRSSEVEKSKSQPSKPKRNRKPRQRSSKKLRGQTVPNATVDVHESSVPQVDAVETAVKEEQEKILPRH